MPQVWDSPEGYRSVRNGIANSALHPISDVFDWTCHAPSQFRLKPPPPPSLEPPPPRPLPPVPSLMTCPSYCCPDGLVPNTKPFCLSRNVSTIIWKLSLSVSDESRRLSLTMMPAGS